MKRIVFLCACNSCRSQMAEGWAMHLFDRRVDVISAGTQASLVDPRSIEVMAEAGIDICESIETLQEIEINHASTLCGDARDQCPLPPKGATFQRRGFHDSASLANVEENHDAALQHYRRARDEIGAWIKRISEEVGAHG